jgi:hypothetical protein
VKKPQELVQDGLKGNADHGVHGLTTLKGAIDLLDSGHMELEVKKKLQTQLEELQAKEWRNRQIAEQIALRQGIQIDPLHNPQNLDGVKLVMTNPSEAGSGGYS